MLRMVVSIPLREGTLSNIDDESTSNYICINVSIPLREGTLSNGF